MALILGELASILTLDDTKFHPEKAVKRLEQQGAPADKAGKKVGEKFTAGADKALQNGGGKLARTVGEAVQRTSRSNEVLAPARKTGEKVGEKITEGTKEQLGGLKATIGTAIAGIGIGEAVDGLLDRSNVGGKVAAQLGSRQAKQTAAEAGQAAGEIYSENFGDNLDQVGEAIVAVNKQIPNIGDELSMTEPEYKKIVEQLLNISSLFDVEISESANAAGQLIKTGLAKNVQQAFDLITAAEQQGIDKSGDFLDNLNEYSTEFRRLGLSGADAFGLIRQGLQGGARDADTIADGIKEFSIIAVDGSASTAAAFKALRLPVKSTIQELAKGGPAARQAFGEVIDRLKAVKDPATRAQLAVALFGTKAEDLGDALYALDLDTASRGLGQFAGATDRAGAAVSDTAGSRLESFRRGLEIKVVSFLGDRVIPKLQEWWQWAVRNRDVLIPLGITIASVGATLLTIAAALKVVTLATAGWTAVLEANPLILIIGLLAGLAVGLYLAWKKSEAFRDAVKTAMAIAKDAIGGVVGVVKSVWSWLLKIVDVAGRVVGAARAIGGAFGWIGRQIGGATKALTAWLTKADTLGTTGATVLHTVGAFGPGGGGSGAGSGGGNKNVPAHAAGGRFRPGLALFGENGPELAVLDGPGFALTAPETARLRLGLVQSARSGGATAGGSVPVTASGAPDYAAMRAAVEAGAYAGTGRALAEGRLRLERRANEVIASIANEGNRSLAGLR